MRVHFTAGDGCGWAIDEDLRLVRESLAGLCEAVPLARAEAIHAPWWVKLLPYSMEAVRGKHVVCTAENSPFYYVTEPEFLKARAMVTQWIVRSREAAAQFAALGIASRYAPYTFDTAVFHPLAATAASVLDLARRWKIPTDRYLIANFHRDTEGADLRAPKLQKGPDVFLEIVARLREQGARFHVLLAGPRRHWLRAQLRERSVPFTFVGEDTGERDDLAVNTLPRSLLNVLYNVADLHLVSSRWEGGPQSVLECAATRCKCVSPRVGLAPDVLAAECLFASVPEACEIVRRDIEDGALDATVDGQFERAHSGHIAPALRESLREIYGSLAPLPPATARSRGVLRQAANRLLHRFRKPRAIRSIACLHRARAGGGSFFDGFIERLSAALEERGCEVQRNAVDRVPDAFLLGRVASDDPLLARVAAPAIGLLDDEASEEERETLRRSSTCLLVSSIEALVHLRELGAVTPVVVLSLPVGIPMVVGGEDDVPARPANFQRLAAPTVIGSVADRILRLVAATSSSPEVRRQGREKCGEDAGSPTHQPPRFPSASSAGTSGDEASPLQHSWLRSAEDPRCRDRVWRLGLLTGLKADDAGNFAPANFERALVLERLIALRKPARILEIGTGRGLGCLSAADSARIQDAPTHITTLDILSMDTKQRWPIELDGERKTIEASRAEVWGRHIEPELRKAITEITGPTTRTLPALVRAGEKFDLIFIDAGHDLYSVVHDLAHSVKLLASCGAILMDDFAPMEEFGLGTCIAVRHARRFFERVEIFPTEGLVFGGAEHPEAPRGMALLTEPFARDVQISRARLLAWRLAGGVLRLCCEPRFFPARS